MEDNRQPSHGRNSPRFQTEPITVSREELMAMFKPYPEIRLAPNNAPYFLVRVPYDQTVNAALNGMRAHFEPRTKNWRVKVMFYRQLLDLAPAMHGLANDEWFDQVNAGAREAADDKRIFVLDSEIADYAVNELIFQNGEDWVVTHVGRPREMNGGVHRPVWLSRPMKIDQALEEGFRPSDS